MMKSIFKLLSAFLVAAGVFSACTQPESPEQVEQGTVQMTVSLPATLSSAEANAYNPVVWKEGDQPVLIQMDADKNAELVAPVNAVCTAQEASFTYELAASAGEFRYFVSKTGCASLQGASAAQLPLEIPAVQKPVVDGIDPAADILTSEISFDVPQSFMVENPWNPSMVRRNAVAALSLSGIPAEHSLKSVVLKTQSLIVGKKQYNVLKKEFDENTTCGGTLTAEIEGTLSQQTDEGGYRNIYLSVWPSALDNYSVTATTVDESGNTHEFTNRYEMFTRAIVLDEHCVTKWVVNMRRQSDKPELPATPTGPEKVIGGGEGPTLELFKKMKAYKDNGISAIDSWWTHLVGYEGVMIHEAKLIQYGEPLHMWVLEADPKKVSFAIGTPLDENVIPARMLESVTHQAERAVDAGKKVIAAFNGDAWGASGGLYTYGVLFKDGLALKKWVVRANDLADTDTFYADELGNVGIVDEEGFKKVTATQNVENAIGGWYRLISQGGEPYAQTGAKDGDPLLRDKNKVSGSLRNFLDRHPRTFMGISEDRVYILAVDGRQKGWSVGLTLNGCARILYSIGCRRGINFDGGGSTAIIKKSGSSFKLMNRPSDGAERDVANSILIVAR